MKGGVFQFNIYLIWLYSKNHTLELIPVFLPYFSINSPTNHTKTLKPPQKAQSCHHFVTNKIKTLKTYERPKNQPQTNHKPTTNLSERPKLYNMTVNPLICITYWNQLKCITNWETDPMLWVCPIYFCGSLLLLSSGQFWSLDFKIKNMNGTVLNLRF